MERIRRIRNSALIIDILLIIAAITALIGLAAFVRAKANLNVRAPSAVSTISVNDKRLDALNQQAESAKVKSASTTGPSDCGSNCGAKSNSQKVNPAKDTCDDQAKLRIVDDYNRQVTTENNRYNSELSTKQNSSGKVDPSLLVTAQSQHDQILMMLTNELKGDLAKIYCLL